MNGELFEYGIQLENSDIRAHVSPKNQTIYVFETKKGRQAIETHKPVEKFGYQKGFDEPTAKGWLVKPYWINDIREINFKEYEYWNLFDDNWTTTIKGRFAVDCVKKLLKCGRFPIWIDAQEDDREKIQIRGTDIVLYANKRIQVKCDSHVAATGNLYLQSAERNPFKRH
jgi:hypothetical protein